MRDDGAGFAVYQGLRAVTRDEHTSTTEFVIVYAGARGIAGVRVGVARASRPPGARRGRTRRPPAAHVRAAQSRPAVRIVALGVIADIETEMRRRVPALEQVFLDPSTVSDEQLAAGRHRLDQSVAEVRRPPHHDAVTAGVRARR